MGRRRKTDRHLPQRMYLRSGSYYFADPDGKWINLGRDYAAAMFEYAQIIGPGGPCRTLGDVIDRYMREVAPDNAERTYKEKLRHGKIIKEALGKVQPSRISRQAVLKFRDIISRNGKVQANRIIGTLKHIFNTAIDWGVVTHNPCTGIKRFKEHARTRYVTDAEFQAFATFAGPLISEYMAFKLLTGLRKGDILNMRRDQLKDDGIHLETAKTKSRVIIEWTPALRAAVDQILNKPTPKVHRIDLWKHLFCTRTGTKYTVSGFSAIWQRKMRKALEKGVLLERFAEHDLRAKTASDTDLEHAASLLTHGDVKTTLKHYRRKAEKVRPLQ